MDIMPISEKKIRDVFNYKFEASRSYKVLPMAIIIIIISSAVYGESPRYCYGLGVIVVQKL